MITFDRRLRFDNRGSEHANELVFLASAAMLTSAMALLANALTLNVTGDNGTEVNRPAHRGENDGRVSYWLQPNQCDTVRFRETGTGSGAAIGSRRNRFRQRNGD